MRNMCAYNNIFIFNIDGFNDSNNWPNCLHVCSISAKYIQGIEELKAKIHQVITEIRAKSS